MDTRKTIRRAKVTPEYYTHIVRPNSLPDEKPELTHCNKRLAGLVGRCCVASVEGASCPVCIVAEQKVHNMPKPVKVEREEY